MCKRKYRSMYMREIGRRIVIVGCNEKEIYSEPKAIINSDKNDTSKNQNVNLEI